jgi:hypothetical protein
MDWGTKNRPRCDQEGAFSWARWYMPLIPDHGLRPTLGKRETLCEN